MTGLLNNPWFYAVAIPAVVLIGFSKGGFGGALGVVGVPLVALVVPPVQAAAILLPILVVMDGVSLWIWRQHNDRTLLKMLLPGALLRNASLRFVCRDPWLHLRALLHTRNRDGWRGLWRRVLRQPSPPSSSAISASTDARRSA